MKFLVALVALAAAVSAAPQGVPGFAGEQKVTTVEQTLPAGAVQGSVQQVAQPRFLVQKSEQHSHFTEQPNLFVQKSEHRFLEQPSIFTQRSGQYGHFNEQPNLFVQKSEHHRFLEQPSIFTQKTGQYGQFAAQPNLFAKKSEHHFLEQPSIYAQRTEQYGHFNEQPNLFAKKFENRFLEQPSIFAKKGENRYQEQSAYLRHGAESYRTQEAAAETVEQDNQMIEPGHYQYRYKTNNGIEVTEQAALKSAGPEAVESVQGVYSWVAPNGEKFVVEYVADETGFHPRGAHIPEIPAAIARSLEWNAAHPDPEARRWDQEY